MRTSGATISIALIIAPLLSTSCSLKSSSQTALHIEIPHSSNARVASQMHARTASTPGTYQAAPTSIADFDCFAVNVTATDIAPASPKQCSLASDTIGVPGGWVPASSNVAIDLEVPNGPNRLIEIYGVRTPDLCPKLGNFNSARMGDIYLLGSVTTDIFNDMSVSISASLDTSKKALSSCKGEATTTLADVTYYVLGPTGAAVSLPLPNNTQYSLTSVSATSKVFTTASDDGTHAAFNYNPGSTTGTDQFTYTTTDSTGATATGKIIIKNVTPFTWTGEAGDSKWSTAGNWCGSVNPAHSACTHSGTPPTTANTAIFDGTCTGTNCNATIDVASTTIGTLRLDHDYTGTLTQDSFNSSFTVVNALKIEGGSLLMNNVAGSFYVPGNLTIAGGILISGTGNSSLGLSSGVTLTAGFLDLSLASSISTGAFTMNGGTFRAPENGAITFNGAFSYNTGTFNAGSTTSALSSILNNTGSTTTINVGSGITFQKLALFSNSAAEGFNLNGNIHVLNELSLNGNTSGGAPALNGGSISVEGDLSVDSGYTGYTGTTQILLKGPGTQTISDLATGTSFPQLSVSKTGTLSINTYSLTALQSLTATAVTHTGSGSLTLPFGDIYPGTLTENSSGSMKLSGGTIHGNLHIQNGFCILSGNTNVTGTLTIDLGASLNLFSHILTQGSLINNGSLIP